jgi:hypothetical protein
MKGFPGFTKISVYYFFMRCEEVKDIDCSFVPFMDETLKGDSTTRDSTSIASTKNKKRKEDQGNNVAGLIEQGDRLMTMLMNSQEAMKVAAEDRKIAATERKESEAKRAKRESIAMQIRIAGLLGKNDELEQLMDDIKKNSLQT